MKKFILIFFAFTIISSSIIHSNNETNILIGIKEIKISEITDEIHLDYWFEDYNWSDDLKNQVNNNKSEYCWVVIGYSIKNNSKKHAMNRVKFIPQYQGEIEKMLVAYTTENEIFTYVYPKQKGGFAQRLLVQKKGYSAEAIEELIKKQKVKVEYSGNKKYIFSIQDAIEIYKNNPELF